MESAESRDDADTTRDRDQIRAAVTARYSGLARAARAGQQITDCDPGPFAAGCFGTAGYPATGELPDGALRASLGCGNPVAVAQMHPGDSVLDLGSGGGIDVLLSARRVGPDGKVYGLDGSPDMIALARENAAQAGVTNAEFLHGHIEDIPLPGEHVDVVISNCVINLSANKPAVLAEAFRVLRPGAGSGSATSSPTKTSTPPSAPTRNSSLAAPLAPSPPRATRASCRPRASPASASAPPATPHPACTRPSSRPPGPAPHQHPRPASDRTAAARPRVRPPKDAGNAGRSGINRTWPGHIPENGEWS